MSLKILANQCFMDDGSGLRQVAATPWSSAPSTGIEAGTSFNIGLGNNGPG